MFFSNKQSIYLSMLCKSKTKATFDGVDNLKIETKKYKKEVQYGNGMTRKGSNISSRDHKISKQ